MKVKISELTGEALDWAVAKCEGFSDKDYCKHDKYFRDVETFEWFCPSSNWAQSGPIIEREKLAVWFMDGFQDENGKVLREACWHAETPYIQDNGDLPYRYEIGPTSLITAMRCYVGSKLGDEVELPTELTQGN